ncbi:YjjG family noncanonical pyrimidine nucleotidase [Sphingobacterium sp. SRCM116780]|uniref:YjjG family noncanonical pyrimidine nucleotidase n=1 Tax=Sphingobacterium sp. SRCM116780 TaxID=2907623 RepID=UPI001F321476|nr:YjjG family noncanonical pyrimidine nucleotidase [Sphingobacterium sp. SRCM116780]UIR55030.1 YjjG family noncanonical pyrimidine nucleotidase [Sphingobacterium sp. SRCM116780]
MFKNKKKDIFFDLDHTIWDFDKNAEETLHELYYQYQFDQLFQQPTSELFIQTYTVNNHRLWNLYHHGKIDKTELRRARFADTFTQLGVDPILFPKNFEEEYLFICPQKTNLFPHAHETLTYLYDQYNLHLISNGFKEACETKLATSDLNKYFKNVFISEVVGVNKPDPRIFHFAINQADARAYTSMMIGDNLDADVRGAMQVGMDAIFFNPTWAEKPQDIPHMITNLKELQSIL